MASNSLPQDASHIDGLLKLISSTVQDIVAEYKTAGRGVPTLDDTEPGPFDSTDKSTLQLTRAVQIVEGACAQLCATVARPSHYISNVRDYHWTFAGDSTTHHYRKPIVQYYQSSCLEVAASARVSDVLLGKSEGVHIAEISKACGIEAGKLGRVLRLLASQHCYREVAPDVFANNRLSMKLLSSDPIASYVGHATDECMKAGAYLWQALSDPECGSSYEVEKAAFKKAHGLSAFDWFTNDARGKSVQARFDHGMIGAGEFNGLGLLTKAYPWQSLPENTVICDVGGGVGHAALTVLKAFPHMKAVVQDLEHVVSAGTALWAAERPSVIEAGRVTFVPIDFFKDRPVPECDIYYVRQVFHDWPDEDCLKILANIRKAMKPSSRVLIHELTYQHVLPSKTEGYTLDRAPEPLLPNFGAGLYKVYMEDINMMSMMNARERSPEMFIQLGKKVGLKFVNFYNSGETGLTELALT
ncbi:S-adenosyl-L-methionine-dependent methyltransferase [Heliocybe sulcata]|uniref:S-adenosyl-L-methionine-dependent methyltransferase n=1 Tax=Heliocybe sulcata TaxID=5364 RepID=A0A5C3MYM6_9AGAM|nr:S-adenosyl-L-methionine-dependent methyltransferase [Heliocybe sulcata]